MIIHVERNSVWNFFLGHVSFKMRKVAIAQLALQGVLCKGMKTCAWNQSPNFVNGIKRNWIELPASNPKWISMQRFCRPVVQKHNHKLGQFWMIITYNKLKRRKNIRQSRNIAFTLQQYPWQSEYNQALGPSWNRKMCSHLNSKLHI